MALAAEFKKASPSKGDIARDKDAGEQARLYAEGGADVVSVLTEAEVRGERREERGERREERGGERERKSERATERKSEEARERGSEGARGS